MKFLIVALTLLSTAYAGPLDSNHLVIMSIPSYNTSYTIRCKNESINLSNCNSIIYSVNEVSSKYPSVLEERETFEITKTELEEALTIFSNDFSTRTFFFWGTTTAARTVHENSRNQPANVIIPSLVVLVSVGAVVDIALSPIIGTVKIGRVINKQINVKKNIENLLNNKKYRTIELVTDMSINYNTYGLTDAIEEVIRGRK